MASEEARGGQIAPASLWGPGTSENITYILRIGKALLIGFIRTLWQKYRTCHPQADLLEQPDGEDVPDSAQVTSLQDKMLRIWQELNNNQELTSMAESVKGSHPLEVLASVAEETFATGINWGRIVVFFYFAYKVIAQSSSNWFHNVVNWAMAFMRDRLAAWIHQQGGWRAMLIYLPSSE
nr:apoptosis regulator BAX-like [Pogona vitticeps]